MKKTIDELRDIATRKTSEGTSTAGPYATLEECGYKRARCFGKPRDLLLCCGIRAC